VDVLEPQAENKGLKLMARGLDQAVVVRTDGGKLRQIAQNLVGNAVKFTDRGRVDVELRETDRWLQLEVRDTGVGIEPEWLDRVFQPFTQVDGSATRSIGGTGLGLAVVRRLLDVLHGDIEVRSEPGVGSTFTMRLPKEPMRRSGQEAAASSSPPS
jgi:signal transduction histidine kinase